MIDLSFGVFIPTSHSLNANTAGLITPVNHPWVIDSWSLSLEEQENNVGSIDWSPNTNGIFYYTAPDTIPLDGLTVDGGLTVSLSHQHHPEITTTLNSGVTISIAQNVWDTDVSSSLGLTLEEFSVSESENDMVQIASINPTYTVPKTNSGNSYEIYVFDYAGKFNSNFGNANFPNARQYKNDIDIVYTNLSVLKDANNNSIYGSIGDLQSISSNGAPSDDMYFSYTPHDNTTGTDEITYKVVSGRTEKTGVIDVSIVNTPPTAPEIVGVFSYAEDADTQTLDISDHVTDANGDTLTFEYSNPINCSINAVDNLGQVQFTPAENFYGDATFDYVATDTSDAPSPTGTVKINITPVNDRPEGLINTISLDEDSTYNSITLVGTDIDNDTLSYIITDRPNKGTLYCNKIDDTYTEVDEDTFTVTPANSNVVYYTPTGDFTGTDEFKYKVNDGTEDSITDYLISLAVENVNDPPEAYNAAEVTSEDTEKVITLSGADPVEGDSITYHIVSDVSHGSLMVESTGSDISSFPYSLPGSENKVSYIPIVDYNGSDSFTFKVNDGTVDSDPATIDITVNPVNDPPVATSFSKTFQEDSDPNMIELQGSDPVEGQDVDFYVVSLPTKGYLINPNDYSEIYKEDDLPKKVDIHNDAINQIRYQPFGNYVGSDSFTFDVWDGPREGENAGLGSEEETVSIIVEEVNDPISWTHAPTTLSVDEKGHSDNDHIGSTSQILATDPDGNDVSYSIVNWSDDKVTENENGVPNIVIGSGQYYAQYTSTVTNVISTTTDKFKYKATSTGEGIESSSEKIVTVTFVPKDDAPVVTNYHSSTNRKNVAEHDSHIIALDPLGSDEEGHTISWSAGTVTNDSDSAATIIYAQYNEVVDRPHLKYDPQIESISQSNVNVDVTYIATANGKTSSGKAYYTVTSQDDIPYFNGTGNSTSFGITEGQFGDSNPSHAFELNATDPDNTDSDISFSVSDQASHGTATVSEAENGQWSLTYTLGDDVNNGILPDGVTWPVEDSFKYKATSNAKDSDEKTCTVSIGERNDAIVVDDPIEYGLTETEGTVSFDLDDHAYDEESDSNLEFAITSGTASDEDNDGTDDRWTYSNGHIDDNGSGSFTYTYTGDNLASNSVTREDEINFNVSVSGDSASTKVGIITVTTTGVNEVPVWVTAPTTAEVYEDPAPAGESTSHEQEILAEDPEGAAVSYRIVNWGNSKHTENEYGTAEITTGSSEDDTVYSIKYTVDSSYNVSGATDTDKFKYDAYLTDYVDIILSTKIVTVTINRVIDDPVADTVGSDTYTDEDNETITESSSLTKTDYNFTNRVGWVESGDEFSDVSIFTSNNDNWTYRCEVDSATNENDMCRNITFDDRSSNYVAWIKYQAQGVYTPENEDGILYYGNGYIYFSVAAVNDSPDWGANSGGTHTAEFTDTADSSWGSAVGYIYTFDPDVDQNGPAISEMAGYPTGDSVDYYLSGDHFYIKRKANTSGKMTFKYTATGITDDEMLIINVRPKTPTTINYSNGIEGSASSVTFSGSNAGASYQHKIGTGAWTDGNVAAWTSGEPGDQVTAWGRAIHDGILSSSTISKTLTVPDRLPIATVSFDKTSYTPDEALTITVANIEDPDTGHTGTFKEWTLLENINNIGGTDTEVSGEAGGAGITMKARVKIQSTHSSDNEIEATATVSYPDLSWDEYPESKEFTNYTGWIPNNNDTTATLSPGGVLTGGSGSFGYKHDHFSGTDVSQSMSGTAVTIPDYSGFYDTNTSTFTKPTSASTTTMNIIGGSTDGQIVTKQIVVTHKVQAGREPQFQFTADPQELSGNGPWTWLKDPDVIDGYTNQYHPITQSGVVGVQLSEDSGERIATVTNWYAGGRVAWYVVIENRSTGSLVDVMTYIAYKHGLKSVTISMSPSDVGPSAGDSWNGNLAVDTELNGADDIQFVYTNGSSASTDSTLQVVNGSCTFSFSNVQYGPDNKFGFSVTIMNDDYTAKGEIGPISGPP